MKWRFFMNIGVLCPSEIALRRFMPAISKMQDIEFGGVAIYTVEERFNGEKIDEEKINAIMIREEKKADEFIENYGGKIYRGYETMILSEDVEAIYIPLPPALHYKWAKLALEHGKHVFLEKPATLSVNDTKRLISIANEKKLALHENYMFIYHKQIEEIGNIIASGEIGDVRLYRMSFGFPRRTFPDFRYDRKLGGGALFDAGGYTIKYASILLGQTARIACAELNYIDGLDVDIYGSGTFINNAGSVVQLSFGMDNSYKCELEVWGSKGSLHTGRILTAPPDLVPNVEIRKNNQIEVRNLSADDSFYKSLQRFLECIRCEKIRCDNYEILAYQAELVEEFRQIAEQRKIKD